MKKTICAVCGMTINEKNYLLNHEAILNSNNVNLVQACPFCGVASRYFNFENVIGYKNHKLNEEVLRILDHAMKLEVFNSEFYKQASDMAEDYKVREMFLALSKIELTHAKIHQRLAGYKSLPVLKKMDYSRYSSDEALLKQAMIREEHAVGFYNKYLEQAPNEYMKFVFQALCSVEEEHIFLTSV